MKIRNGFVSNSSSSSFVISVPTGVSLTKDLIVKAFSVEMTSTMYPIAVSMAEMFVNRSEKVSDLLGAVEEGEIRKREGNFLLGLMNKGRDVYAGSMKDQDGPIEAVICEMGFNYISDEITIYKEAGY
jgi:hypothetical protein